jgi:hypothetical protein
MVDFLARSRPLRDAIRRQGRRHTFATSSWSRRRERRLDVLDHLTSTGSRSRIDTERASGRPVAS